MSTLSLLLMRKDIKDFFKCCVNAEIIQHMTLAMMDEDGIKYR